MVNYLLGHLILKAIFFLLSTKVFSSSTKEIFLSTKVIFLNLCIILKTLYLFKHMDFSEFGVWHSMRHFTIFYMPELTSVSGITWYCRILFNALPISHEISWKAYSPQSNVISIIYTNVKGIYEWLNSITLYTMCWFLNLLKID